MEKKVQATTLLINSLIFRPTHLGFFDICLLLAILTMATHSNREKRKKMRGKGRRCCCRRNYLPLHFLLFSLSLFLSYFLCFFLFIVLFYETKKEPMYEHILPSFFLSFFLSFSTYSSVSSLSMLVSTRRKRKKEENIISCKTDERYTQRTQIIARKRDQKPVQIYSKIRARETKMSKMILIR